MNTKPKILVLSATGKVGGKVANLLAESKDFQVVAGVRYFSKEYSLVKTSVSQVPPMYKKASKGELPTASFTDTVGESNLY